MDLNERLNIELRKMNKGFSKLHEDYNLALYDGVKYRDNDFIYTGIRDFFNNLNNVLNGYVQGYDKIMMSYTNTVKASLSNENNKKIKNNMKVISERPIRHYIETYGFEYSMDIIKSVDLTILSELLDLDKILLSISNYSSGELIQNYNFEFLPNFNRPTWIAKILNVQTPVSDKEFAKVAFRAFRNGEAEPKLIILNKENVNITLKDYDLNAYYLNNIESVWRQIYTICKKLMEMISLHRSRLEKIYRNSTNSLNLKTGDAKKEQEISDMNMMIIFMDKLKKASLVIDDILNIYSRLLKAACAALIAKIAQEQYILITVLENDRSKE